MGLFHRQKQELSLGKLAIAMALAFVGLTMRSAVATTQLDELNKKSSEFNEMIKESQTNTEQLRKSLKEQAGIKLDDSTPGTVAKEKVQAPREAEQIVAESARDFWKEKKKLKTKTDSSQSEQNKRLSQEIKESAF